MLTLERIRGAKISDTVALKTQGVNPQELAVCATEVIFKMIFDDGFFHADPHPGNFFIEAEGQIGLIDFGMTGTVDERTQELLGSLLLAITGQKHERIVDVLLELGVAHRRVDRGELRNDVKHLMARYWGKPLGEIELGPLLGDAFSVIRRHHMHLPSNLALLLKTLVMVEGLGARLDPSFRITTVIAPYVDRLLLRQYSPSVWIKKFGHAGLDLAQLSVEMPQQMRRIMGEIERSSFGVGVRPEGSEPVLNRFERSSNRIVLGVIAAAFINSLAVLLSIYRPPAWERWAWAVFAFGFLCALLLGVYLVWSILRSMRR